MRISAVAAAAASLVSFSSIAAAQALQPGAPSGYRAVTDRGPRAKPALPTLGAAGFQFVDPVFGSRMWRLTDRATRPDHLDRSFRTPSGTHENAWSSDLRYFYVVSTDGTIVPFEFDPVQERASRLDATPDGDGGLVLRFYIEPQFSYVTPGVVYGSFSGAGASLRTIDQFDFSTRSYTTLVDLDALVPGLEGTYVGGIESSGGPVERIMTFFGGASQDRHVYALVFDRRNPSNRHLVNTGRSTVDGMPANIPLRFSLHAAAIDRSGRYVTLYPAGADLARGTAANYEWDTLTNTFVALPIGTARSGGHDAYGYGVRINQDCCTSTRWDGAQWQMRALDSPLVTRDVIQPVLDPKEVYIADHPSWHNAAPDRFVPYISALYRYGADDVEWRAWDDEIVAVQTDGADGAAAEVWRFAHHRSDVRNDNDPSRISFWYTPRPNVSPDGRWVLFTSNWEKMLGRDPGGAPGETARQDVFLLALDGDGARPNSIGRAIFRKGSPAPPRIPRRRR